MPNQAPTTPQKRYVFAFALIASLVALWGIGHRVHATLLPLFADEFRLEGFRLALTTSIYNFVYIAWALPAALYARRFGYKATILLGLGFVAVGAFTFYPAAETRVFAYYAVATMCMASGWLTLEIAANPLFAAWGSPKHAVFRLNLAQCLYPLGALAGIFIGRWLLSSDQVLPDSASSSPLAHPYIVIGACVLLLAFVVEETVFPAVAQDRIPGLKGIGSEIRTLLARPLIRYAMVAQFCAIAATGLTWAMIAQAVRHGGHDWNFIAERDVAIFGMVLFVIGRFIGTGLMLKIAPATVLLFYAAAGGFLALSAAFFGGQIAMIGLVGLGVALSISWPTILGLAIAGLGQHMKVATALTAISGALGGLAYNVALSASGGLVGTIGLIAITLLCTVIGGYAWAARTKSLIA